VPNTLLEFTVPTFSEVGGQTEVLRRARFFVTGLVLTGFCAVS
jgi:hypothetical protein